MGSAVFCDASGFPVIFDYVLGRVELSSPSSIQQDQLILSWTLTNISITTLPQVASRKTLAEVWDGLRKLYASGTHARQLHIRLHLQSIRKGGLSIEDYFSKISILKNALASTGEEGLKESEIILITLGGLGNEFESIVTAITTPFNPDLTFSGVCKLLMDHNLRLEKSRSTNSVVVNIATKVTHPANSQRSPRSDIQCQICTRKGHSAADCYNRLNFDRYPALHGRVLSSLGPNGSTRTQTSENLVATSSGTATMSYPDSRATSHITASSENI